MAKPSQETGAKKPSANVPNGVCSIQSNFQPTSCRSPTRQVEVISGPSAGAAVSKGASQRPPFSACADGRRSPAGTPRHRSGHAARNRSDGQGPRLRPGNRDPCPAGGRSGDHPEMIPRVTPRPHHGCPVPKRRGSESPFPFKPMRLHQAHRAFIPPLPAVQFSIQIDRVEQSRLPDRPLRTGGVS